MTEQEFNEIYDSRYRIKAISMSMDGFTTSGIILDGIHTATSGEKFVFIDNFFNRHTIDSLIRIENTLNPWINQ